VPGGVNGNDRSEEAMIYGALQKRLPGPLRRWVLHFEASIEDAVSAFAAGLADRTWVLDAGAGEGQFAQHFRRQRYVGVDLAVGDSSWNYSRLDCVADLVRLPFRDSTFDACLNVVTLEHLREPAAALAEIGRSMKPGAPLLIIVPHEWEVHQAPHDFFRYTQHGLRHLLEKSGFVHLDIQPVGGYFRLLARRLLNGLQFFPGIWFVPAALVLAPPALVLPLFDGLDRDRNFTLGYICTAKRN
jgi:SAM-dependent methyltransferase